MEITLNNINILKSSSDNTNNYIEIKTNKTYFDLSESYISATSQFDSNINTEIIDFINYIKIDNINLNDYISIVSLSTPVDISELLGYSIKKYILSEELSLVISIKHDNNTIQAIAFSYREKSKYKFDYNKINTIIEKKFI